MTRIDGNDEVARFGARMLDFDGRLGAAAVLPKSMTSR